jgi:hypothetical protein
MLCQPFCFRELAGEDQHGFAHRVRLTDCLSKSDHSLFPRSIEDDLPCLIGTKMRGHMPRPERIWLHVKEGLAEALPVRTNGNEFRALPS